MFIFYRRYFELQKYSHMQEETLQNCKNFLDEMYSSEEEENPGHENEVDVERSAERMDRSNSSASILIESKNDEYANGKHGFYTNRSAFEEREDALIHEPSPSPASESPPQSCCGGIRQGSKIPRPPPPRRAVIHKDIRAKESPLIPGHVIVQTRVTPAPEVKIFHQKRPIYNKDVGSTGYRTSTRRRAPIYVPKPPPPVQQQQYQPRQSSYDTSHIDFMQCEESLTIKRTTIKGIAKRNLIRKDLMNLRDPSVRPRGAPKPTGGVGMSQEIVPRGFQIKREHELVLPRISQRQPPRAITKQNPQYQPSQIPKLPIIQQQHQGLNGIPRTRAHPQPPVMSRSRAGASHRRYAERKTGLSFSRRQ